MRKFKLIKTYPGSAKLGTLASKRDFALGGPMEGYDYMLNDTLHQPLPKNKVEDFPEFWERVSEEKFIQQLGRVTRLKDNCIKHVLESNKEIDVEPKEIKEEKLWGVSTMKEEPNYLITAFRFKDSGDIWDLKNDGSYGANPIISKYTLNEMLKGYISVSDNSVEIYSVKNSKGEEFTIGDKCNNDYISKFRIGVNNDNSRIYVNSKNCSWGLDLDSLVKDKQPLYTTTDGFDVYEGEADRLFFLLNKDLTMPFNDIKAIYIFSARDKEVSERFLTFTSEENRDKYIKENTYSPKPVLISADGKELFMGDYCYVIQVDFNNEITGNYLEFKIDSGVIIGDKIFSTKDLAKEYIDNNKPKFSLKEIESCYPSPTDSPLFTTFIANLKKLGK